jgi:hypothetical protein
MASGFHDERGRFLPGNPGGGRKPGSRGKLSEAFLDALCADYEAHGKAAIERMRETNPVAYLRMIASLLPKEFHVEATRSPLEGLTLEQKRERAIVLARRLGLHRLAANDEPESCH